MNHNYYGRLAELVGEATIAINNYNGEKAITLPTGERALDNDDSLIIIGTPNGEPIIRDKREQKIREVYMQEGKEYPEEHCTDVFLGDSWDEGEICSYADQLLGI